MKKERSVVFVILLLLCTVFIQSSLAYSIQEIPLYKRLFSWFNCNFVRNPASSVENELRNSIFGQDKAVDRIVKAFHKWEDDVSGSNPMPLTFIFTGATGVGKSETANRILSGLISKGYFRKHHDGYLHLFGDDYQDASNPEKLKQKLNSLIAQKLLDCQGNLIIIFDEVQMAHKPVLRVLLPLLQGSHSQLKHPSLDRPLDASRLILILISDIGIPTMEEYIVSLAQNRLQMPYKKWQSLLEHEMREQVQNEFIRGGLPLGSLVDK